MNEKISLNQNEKVNLNIKERSSIINGMDIPLLDSSYRDYILDLGDEIYLYEESESEEIKS